MRAFEYIKKDIGAFDFGQTEMAVRGKFVRIFTGVLREPVVGDDDLGFVKQAGENLTPAQQRAAGEALMEKLSRGTVLAVALASIGVTPQARLFRGKSNANDIDLACRAFAAGFRNNTFHLDAALEHLRTSHMINDSSILTLANGVEMPITAELIGECQRAVIFSGEPAWYVCALKLHCAGAGCVHLRACVFALACVRVCVCAYVRVCVC